MSAALDRADAPIRSSRARVLVAALVLLAAGCLGPGSGSADAHGETTPVIRTVIDGISPSVAGLSVRIDPGLQTNLSMANTSATEVVVIGDLREPFLRIGPKGVFANANSPTWYGSGNPDGIALNLPHSARAGAPPHWMRVSLRPLWAWFDRRVQPPGAALPAQALQGRRPVRLVDWGLPLRYGSRRLQIRGHVEYRPPIGAIVASIRPHASVAPGVEVSVLGGAAPGLFLSNAGSALVTVLGTDGMPFARVGPRGVDVNIHSPVYLAERGAVPPTAASRPVWRHVASVPRFAWVDTRLRYGSLDPPSDVSRQTRPVTLRSWAIPIQTALGRRDLQGTLDWIPTAQPAYSGSGHGAHAGNLAGWLIPSAALAAIGALGALELRRRQTPRQPRKDLHAG